MGSQSQAAPVPRAGPRRDLGATSARTRWPRPPARSGVSLREPAPPGPLRGRCASGASARAAGGDSPLISGDGLSTSSQRRDHWFEGRKGDPGGLFGGGPKKTRETWSGQTPRHLLRGKGWRRAPPRPLLLGLGAPRRHLPPPSRRNARQGELREVRKEAVRATRPKIGALVPCIPSSSRFPFFNAFEGDSTS